MVWQFVLNGLITGVLYSLLALGFALVYNTTHIFHIAAAGIYVVAAYSFWLFAFNLHFPVSISAVLAVIVTMGVSILCEKTVYLPLKKRDASPNISMIASIGIMTILVNVVALVFGNETKIISNDIQKVYTIGSIIITTPQLVQIVLGTFFLVGFCLLLERSEWGVRIRALSCDAATYRSLGYNELETRTIVFLFSGLFVGAASCLTVYDVGMDPNMGMNVLINAMVAMIIGGTGRFSACILGGLSLGLLQSLVVLQFSSSWQNAITFIVLLIFLFLRPQGIMGYKSRTV